MEPQNSPVPKGAETTPAVVLTRVLLSQAGKGGRAVMHRGVRHSAAQRQGSSQSDHTAHNTTHHTTRGTACRPLKHVSTRTTHPRTHVCSGAHTNHKRRRRPTCLLPRSPCAPSPRAPRPTPHVLFVCRARGVPPLRSVDECRNEVRDRRFADHHRKRCHTDAKAPSNERQPPLTSSHTTCAQGRV